MDEFEVAKAYIAEVGTTDWKELPGVISVQFDPVQEFVDKVVASLGTVTDDEKRSMAHWDKPILATDGTGQLVVYNECGSCENYGPHPCEEVAGVLVVTCVSCSNEFGWKR